MTKKEFIACRVAKLLKGDKLINLGAGIPSLIINYLDKEDPPLVHAENGIIGVGPDDPSLPRDIYRCDASVNPVTIIPEGSIIDSTTSFGFVRGGHLDTTVLGTMQVDMEGNIANWMVAGGRMIGMGGAMDLVVGAKRVIVATEHNTKDGNPKILKRCTYPLTGMKVVDTIVTELALIKVTPKGLLLKEIAPGISVKEVCDRTGAPLEIDKNLYEMLV